MSKKRSSSSAGRQTAAQPSRTASRPSARRSPAVWALGALGLLAVIVVVLAVQGAATGTPATNMSATSVPAVNVPTTGPAMTSLPAEISVAEAAAKREAGAFILDVREPDEWDEFHIPGATLISLGDLEARLKDVPRDKEVVVVCRSGNRSRTGRDLLVQAGFTRVTSLAGGLKEWTAAKLPTVTGP